MKRLLMEILLFFILSGMVFSMATTASSVVSTWSEKEVKMAQSYGLAEWASAGMDLRSEITRLEWEKLLNALCGELSDDDIELPELVLAAETFTDNDSAEAPVSRGAAILSSYDLIQSIFPDMSTTPIHLIFEDNDLFLDDNERYAASFLYVYGVLKGVGSRMDPTLNVVPTSIKPDRNIKREEALTLAARIIEAKDYFAELAKGKKGWGVLGSRGDIPDFEEIEAFLRDNFDAFEAARYITGRNISSITATENAVVFQGDAIFSSSEDFKLLTGFMHQYNIPIIYSDYSGFYAEVYTLGRPGGGCGLAYSWIGSSNFGLPEHLVDTGYSGSWYIAEIINYVPQEQPMPWDD